MLHCGDCVSQPCKRLQVGCGGRVQGPPWNVMSVPIPQTHAALRPNVVLPPVAPRGNPHDGRTVAALREATFDRMESVLSVLRAKRRQSAATLE